MKKVICFLMATAMCLAMTACGSGATSSSTATKTSSIASSESSKVTSSKVVSSQVVSSKATSVEGIVKQYFPNSKVEYTETEKELDFTANVEDSMGASLTFAAAGGDLAKCLRDIIKFDKNVNVCFVTISSHSYPSVITCQVNPDKLRAVTDWSNFTQSDIKSVCDAYSDCKK